VDITIMVMCTLSADTHMFKHHVKVNFAQ